MAPSVSGEVWAIHGENGHIVDNWPFYLEERGFHASPLVVSLSVHVSVHVAMFDACCQSVGLHLHACTSVFIVGCMCVCICMCVVGRKVVW